MSQPSVSRHHADWLSLVEVSGPFVSLPVLMRVFPQGLEPRDPAQAKALRAAYEEWQHNPAAPGNQRAWVMHVLTTVLGYTPEQIAEGQALPAGLEAKMPEMGETLRPDFALVGTAGSDAAGQVQLLIASYMAEQPLDKPVIGKHWKATPATRMMELLHGIGVPLGLVTNGEHWMLVYAPRGETTGFASWYGALWLDEPITLRAFHSLFGVRHFFGVSADNTLLAMLKESANDQQEVTDQLGHQVREAVEVLVKSVDALDRENHRALLKDVPETVLYDAALTIMMRLVFLFAAEERGLLHLGKPLYDDNYAVSTLQEQLQEVADQHGEEVLERRFDAWTRLLATFRAVHGGIQHQDLLMPAYGGSLFDPDRYPFLEGRGPQSSWKTSAAEPLAVNNRVVLHLLNSLQRLRVRVLGGGPAESRRISFRALGVEQIGHVYEGLLDRTAVRASEPILGVKGTRDKEGEIPLATLESLSAQGRDQLLEFVKDETGRSLSALSHALDEVNLLDEHSLLIACGYDKKLLERIRPYVNLIREDSFGRPSVTLADGVYATTATTRRSTSTHYTPPSLTEPIVQHALEPLIYEGPVEGLPPERWKLKSPKAILDLKVCDMAMGSGAFLVQACRYLAERLVEAWEDAEKQHPGQVLITPEGRFSEGAPSERLVPAEANERIAIARRVVADRCIYGVDVNPMAVEMAKLSLWLITVDANRPFTFLDHAFKCGDSLLGVSSLEQLQNFSLRPAGGKQHTFATMNLRRSVEEAKKKRETLEAMPSDTPNQIAAKAALYSEAEEAIAKMKVLADCLIALELRGLDHQAYEDQRAVAADHAEEAMRKPLIEFQRYAHEQLRDHRTFHWVVEFPEVFVRGGFDSFVGNPPFVGGKRIRTFFGDAYAKVLGVVVPESNANADLSVKFHLRAFRLMHSSATYGLLATDRIAEGDTRHGGLEQILRLNGLIYCAETSKQWPGDAAVRYSVVHVISGNYLGRFLLDGDEVRAIDSALMPADGESRDPEILNDSWGTSYVGCAIQGAGFILERAEASELLRDKVNAAIVRPFLIANDLNHVPDLQPRRWIINFDDRDLAAASKFSKCLEIVRERVKPHRDTVNRKAHREKWWQFGDRRPGLVKDCSHRKSVIACAMTTVDFKFAYVPAWWVFDQTVVIVVPAVDECYAVLESSIHKSWAYELGSGFGSGGAPRYNPSRCFETFPFPLLASKVQRNDLRSLGNSYHAYRKSVMKAREQGLTKIYSCFHDRREESGDIARLRALQVELDQAVVVAYGWDDMELAHDFHETKHGVRYTISELARRAVVNRLLVLNHQRHGEEEAEKTAQAVSAPVRSRRKKRHGAEKLPLDLQ